MFRFFCRLSIAFSITALAACQDATQPTPRPVSAASHVNTGGSAAIVTESFSFEFEPEMDPALVRRRVERDRDRFQAMGISVSLGKGERSAVRVRVNGPMPRLESQREAVQQLFDDLGVGGSPQQ